MPSRDLLLLTQCFSEIDRSWFCVKNNITVSGGDFTSLLITGIVVFHID